MNSWLLTPQEKNANRLLGNRRNAQRQACRRRERLLADLAVLGGTELPAQLLTPRENLDLLTAHLARAKAVVARVRRALRLTRMAQPGGPPAAIQNAPPRPTRALRVQNRGRVWPALLADANQSDQPMTLVEAMAAITRHAEDGASPHVLLDFCVRVSGLPWETSAAILHERRIIPATFSSTDILAIRRAGDFWDRYREGRAACAAAVSAGEIPLMHGDFALFETGQLHAILPGLHVPTLLRRTAYVVNLVTDLHGLCLDLFAFPSVLPLVRHPFFNTE